ncbi:hypothetical protein [Marinobacter sp. SS21]|uniref:hypothetical protein n=1 Tax=Marinobacter sp. SS21 TaxID=2979460 RepID=UPI0023303014|nr:hypothetical protein [Marinobacter sp. SS21]MDC0661531.1 hypothetical protein [Marinobacter sp. SS21]
MVIQRMMLFASATAFAFASAFAVAEGQADRRNETGVTQQADPIKEIHQTYGATAAGPTSDEGMMKDTQALEDSWGIDFPEHVETAHERKRYIFDSEDF